MAAADKRGDGGDSDGDDGCGDGDGDGDSQCEFDGEIPFFLFRLVGIIGPQWHFGSTLANRLAL